MSTNFSGITFANQNATPSDDGIIRRAMLGDGILTGCAISYTGSTLTIQPGQYMICGRQIRHTSVQNIPIADATTGFARVVLTIDFTKTSTKETFEQVDSTVEYASAENGFSALVTNDINASGTMYQVVLAVVSLSAGGISGITYQIGESGSGVGSSKSSIIVTAPTGSVVYIENQDGKRKDTGEKGGVWTFKGCDIGTWTVHASIAGKDSFTKVIEITEEVQLMRYYVTVSYNFEIFDHITDWITNRENGEGGITNNNDGSISFSTTGKHSTLQGHVAYFANPKIDLTKYKTLYVEFDCTGLGECRIGFYSKTTSPYNWINYVAIHYINGQDTLKNEIIQIDIEDINEDLYFAVSFCGYSQNTASTRIITIRNAWLVPK